MAIPFFTRPKPTPNTVTIGGQAVEVTPLTLERTIALTLVLAPHIAQIEAHLPQIKTALEDKRGNRGRLLSQVFMHLREEIASVPGDMTKALSLLLGTDYEWTARNATPADFINALPLLDSVNNFYDLWEAAKALGLMVGYKVNG